MERSAITSQPRSLGRIRRRREIDSAAWFRFPKKVGKEYNGQRMIQDDGKQSLG